MTTTADQADVDPGAKSAPGYWFSLECPRCSGELTHVTSGSPGRETRAVACCEPCRRHWCVVVQLVDVTGQLGHPVAAPGTRHSRPENRRRHLQEAGAA